MNTRLAPISTRLFCAERRQIASLALSLLFLAVAIGALLAPSARADYWETTETSDPGPENGIQAISTYADGTASLNWIDQYVVKSQAVDAGGNLTGEPVNLLDRYSSLSAVPIDPETSVVVGYRGFGDEPYKLTARTFNSSGPVGAPYDVLANISNETSREVWGLRVLANGDGSATALWTERIGGDSFVRARRLGLNGPLGSVQTIYDSSEEQLENAIGSVVSVSSSLDGTAWIVLNITTPFGVGKHRAIKLGLDSGNTREVEFAEGAWLGSAAIAALPGGSAQVAWTVGGYWTGAIYTRSVEGKSEHRCYFGSEGWSLLGETCVATTGGSFAGPNFPFQIAIASDRRGTVSLVATDRGGSTQRWTVNGGQVQGPTLLGETSSSYDPFLQMQAGPSYSVAMWQAFAYTSSAKAFAASSNGSTQPQPVADWQAGPIGSAQLSSAVVADANLQPPIKAAWMTHSGSLIVTNFVRTDDQSESEPAPSGTAINRAKTCPAVRVIGVRGSGEDPGVGKPVSSFITELRRQVESRFDRNGRRNKFSYKALEYDAISVSGLNTLVALQAWASQALDSGWYFDSVSGGRAALIDALAIEAASPCADITKYVLAGYSQGAQVIGDVLESYFIPSPIRDRLFGVALFGDPRFASKTTGVTARGTFNPSLTGILGQRRTDAFLPLPSRVGVYSFCRAKDHVCQGTREWRLTGNDSHERYPDAETHWAAWLVANRALRQPVSSRDPELQMRLTGGLDNRVEFTCRVPARGVCQVNLELEELRVGSLFAVTHRARLIGNADSSGVVKLTYEIPTAYTSALTIAVKGRAIGIAPGHVEADTNFAELLK